MVFSLWDVTESLYIEISRSDGPQKELAHVDLSHLKSYWVNHTISLAVLGNSKSSWVIKTSYVRGPPIQNPINCDSVVTTTTLCIVFCFSFLKNVQFFCLYLLSLTLGIHLLLPTSFDLIVVISSFSFFSFFVEYLFLFISSGITITLPIMEVVLMNSGKIVKMHALKPKPGWNTIFIISGAQHKPRASTLKNNNEWVQN